MGMENRRFFNQEGKEAKNFYHLSDDGGEESGCSSKYQVDSSSFGAWAIVVGSSRGKVVREDALWLYGM